jgi:hypothetical protein
MHMKKALFLRNFVVIALLFFITYALSDGIHYGSALGTILALCSLSALVIAIYLFRKMTQLKEEEAEY